MTTQVVQCQHQSCGAHTTLQYFKDYSESLMVLYQKVIPFYNATYAICVIKGLHAFADHAGGEPRFANQFALHCLDDIKRLTTTMLEEDFIKKNTELGVKLHFFLLLLKTQLSQLDPNTTSMAMRAMQEAKHANIIEVEKVLERFNAGRRTVMLQSSCKSVYILLPTALRHELAPAFEARSGLGHVGIIRVEE